MFSLIIILPLLGFFSGSLLGRHIGKGAGIVTTLFTGFTCFICINFLIETICTGNVYIMTLADWIRIDTMNIDWSFCFDTLTAVMLVVVTFISTLVHLYSTEYMEYDPHFPRFMSYLSLFTFFMIILVTGNNFLQMFIGWEGVGVSSYLLINFWFTRIQANKAAIKAMLVNRVGDFFLLLAMFTMYVFFNSLNYDVVFSLVSLTSIEKINIGIFEFSVIDIICLFLFFGAMGKSAQIGLHTWLPDAMEGPTPVSALIHAATMVTAGVFLIIRCSFLFENSPLALSVVCLVGSMTAFFAATTGLFQNDMKRVIAYSTCSQLGYMIFCCGLSGYEVGIFHLSNHAFFKALLFLGAGSVIHAMSDEQDMRKMGGLKNLLPFTYATSVIGSLALIGFPFLAGFYSKDIILEVAASTWTVVGKFAYILGLLAAFCTAYYSTRLLFLVFLSNPNGNKNTTLHAHEPTLRMGLPLFILSICSILVGYLTKDLFIGFGGDFWNNSIYINPNNYVMTDIEFLPFEIKTLPLFLTIGGVLTAYFIYTFKLEEYFILKGKENVIKVFNFFNKKWYFDRVYNEIIVQNVLKKSYYFFYQEIDRGLIERFGPVGISEGVHFISSLIRNLTTGFIIHYLIYFFFSIVVFFLATYCNLEILLVTLVLLFLSTYYFEKEIKILYK
jgi:proton-translocating NADH-quinone oxidoreductase chain L